MLDSLVVTGVDESSPTEYDFELFCSPQDSIMAIKEKHNKY